MPKPVNDTVSTSSNAPVSITNRFINQLVRPGKGEPRASHWDAQLKGFGLPAYKSGQLVYVLQYRMPGGGPTRTQTIGKHSSPWTPDGAREHACELLEQVRKGIDTATRRTEAKSSAAKVAADAGHFAFDALADRFIERHVRQMPFAASRTSGDVRSGSPPWFANPSVLDTPPSQDLKDMWAHVGSRSRERRQQGSQVAQPTFHLGQSGLAQSA